MKLRDLPSWLARDVIAFVGMMVAFWSFLLAFVPAVARMRTTSRGMSPAEFGRICRLFAEAEGWLRYAIARRAFRLAGLKASRVRFFAPTPCAGGDTFISRSGSYLRDCSRMDELAEKMAQRIRRLLRVDPAALRAREEIPATISNIIQFADFLPRSRSGRGRWIDASSRRDGGGSRRPVEGLRVRAPPWPELNREKSNLNRLAAPLPRSRLYVSSLAHGTRPCLLPLKSRHLKSRRTS